jgi:hypothetical protein
LASEPTEGKRLQQQLEDATFVLTSNKDKNYFKAGTLYVSAIFKWFKADFNDDIAGFFHQYALRDLKRSLTAHGTPMRIDFLKYDWRLSGN